MSVLDTQILARFVETRGKPLNDDFVASLQEMVRYRLVAASRAGDEGNWTAVIRSVSDIADEVVPLGLADLAQACRHIADEVGAGRTDRLGTLLSGLQEECLAGIGALRDHL